MDFIRDIADWVANEPLNVLATLFPLLMFGLLGLYLLWLLIGYLRVSQVGLHDDERREAIALPRPTERPALPEGQEATGDEAAEGEAVEAPATLETTAGMPYCPVDGLAFPAGARFCTRCERDLVLDCTNCGATLDAGAASCYRCGTPTGTDAARAH